MKNKALVLWFTGISGAGKSAIAEQAAEAFKSKKIKTLIIDGDHVRNKINTHLSFTREDILENNRLIALLCLRNIYVFDVILVPIISPYIIGRKRAREIIGDTFCEVYIKASIEELIRRDTKGFYKKTLNGEMDNLIGFSTRNPYEEPQRPDLLICTCREELNDSVERLIQYVLDCRIKISNKPVGSFKG